MFNFNENKVEINLPDGLIDSIAKAIINTPDLKDKLYSAIAEYAEKYINSELKKVEGNVERRIESKVSDSLQKMNDLKYSIKKSIKDDLKSEVQTMAQTAGKTIILSEIKSRVKKEVLSDLSGLKDELKTYFIDELKKDAVNRKPITFLIQQNMAQAENVPFELSQVSKVYECDFESDYSVFRPGVYFLYKGSCLQYIGQSISILNRIRSHREDKDFDKVFYIPVSEEDLDHVETHLINKYKPPLNKKDGVAKYKDLSNIPNILKVS